MANMWERPAPPGQKILKRSAWWLTALGVLLFVVGILAIGSALVATVATMTFVGFVLVVAGVVHLVDALAAGSWRHVLPGLFLGILSGVVGALLVARPLAAAASITLLLAGFFLAAGLFRLMAAAVVRPPGWSWAVLSGVVGALLGLFLLAGWPSTATWVIGTFVGVDLLFAGARLIGTATSFRRIAATAVAMERPREPPEARGRG